MDITKSTCYVAVTPFNLSLVSRFSPNESISTLLDELFLERWQNTSSYENYDNACTLTLCGYEYEQEKSALFVSTSLLGLYGGLTVSLRLLVGNGLQSSV